jgi:Cdc6-like AAA superfamily ATPase
MSQEDENIPIEITIAGSAAAGAAPPPSPPRPSVASVAAAALAMMPDEPAQPAAATTAPGAKRTIKPAPKKRADAAGGVAAAVVPQLDPRQRIHLMKKELDDGRKRLKPEELNNPFNKEFNKLLLKKELLEREMTLHDIGILPGDDDSDDEAAAAAATAAKGLYPTLNDPNFNTKIALRKEFFDTKMDVDNTKNVEEEAEILCNAQIELAPNQQFVRNFLSVETPYNSLLLYHGLGTGKTCSAISVAEEMRDYMKQMGITQQIIVIASPNVQENFRLQLFDERELREIEPGVWNIRACTGNKFIKEINPMNMKGLTRDKIIKQIRRLISSHYLFFGYNEFANYARTHASSIGLSQDDAVIQEVRRKGVAGAAGAGAASAAKKGRKSAADLAKVAEMETLAIETLSVAKLRKLFANTLIIIDEVHNIRITDDNRDKRVAKILFQIVQKVNNVRLLLLSGTPMYNSYKEIVWLINLMNLNDRRATIDIADVFDERGNFRVDAEGREIGKELLTRKATGYVSFVRGENPYTFPYRIYPREHSPEFSLLERLHGGGGGGGYPRTQLNGRHIDQPIEHIDVYLTQAGDIQEAAYRFIINDMKAMYIYKKTAMMRRKKAVADAAEEKGTGASKGASKGKGKGAGAKPASMGAAAAAGEAAIDETTVVESADFPSFENMDTIGYAAVQKPLEALNIVYPHPSLIEYINDPNDEFDIAACIGKEGLRHVMSYQEVGNPPMRLNFEYRPEFIRAFKLPDGETTTKSSSRIFAPENIGRYSAKIKNICDKIVRSDGVILVYSQYIDGGVVPIALALEEYGFTRYSAAGANSSFFRSKPTQSIDAITLLPQRQHQAQFPSQPFQPARYSVITGDPTISPDNLYELKALTSENNTNGENVKVVIISVAGSEGLDFKNIRQVHILEPWYNMNLLEQIIGRAIRNCSHKRLPFSQRNVELYLYGTMLTNPDIEAIDLYLYRLSEFKAIKIGTVSRLLRTSAVDCLLNVQHNTQTAAQLNQNVRQNLSSRKQIDYQVGARPYSALCDYMERCEYVCRPTFSNGRPIQEQNDLYGMDDDSDDEGGGGGDPRSDVRMDTFNEKFMSMNLDKIIHKIRELYKDAFFYKKTGPNGIIAHVNAVRHYPVAQINLALTQMVTDMNEYVNDKYGRLGRIINVGDYYLFQPIELTDKRISIHERSVPVPHKHAAIEYPLSAEITEDYLGILPKQPAVVPNKKVVQQLAAAAASAAAAAPSSEHFPVEDPEAGVAAAAEPLPDTGAGAVDEMIITLFNTFETCKTVHEKPTKDQDEWYYYCGKVINQISQTDEFQTTREELHELVIANLLEHLLFEGSLSLLNYLYQKNNYSMNTGSVSATGGIQPLTPFERMLLQYYSQQVIHRPLVGRRAAAAGAAAAAANPPEDKGMLLFDKKNKDLFTLVVLRYETREWSEAEPEDERDFELLLGRIQTEQIRSMNMIIGFISLFKMEYLVFKVKVMSKKRDKGARCDQSGKTDAIGVINMILSMNPLTQGDEYKLTTENTKQRTQRELCVFQEFLLRTFHQKRIGGRKWFFTPCESLLCDIERLHIEK